MPNNDYQPRLDDDISVEYQGELMDNYFSESTIDTSGGLRAVRFQDNKSILLYFDKNKALQLLIQQDGTQAGWTSYTLSSPGIPVTAFDVYHQLQTNRLRIAYAAANNGVSQLQVSNEIDLSTVKPLLFTTNLHWTAKRLVDTQRTIDHISMSAAGLLYSTAHLGQDANYAYFRYDEQPVAYTLPENTPHAIQLKTGQIYGEFGIFILYDMQVENTLLFQSFPDAEDGEISSYRFRPSSQISAFSTLDIGRKGDSILFLSGTGIFRYNDPESDVEIICAPDEEMVFDKLEVTSNEQEISIWAIGQNDGSPGLYYLTNRFYQDEQQVAQKWTAPIMMQRAIEDFAAIKSSRLTNQLFLFGAEENENHLIHFWQDQTTTNWHEQPVTVPNGEELLQKNTFTLHIRFDTKTAMRSFHGQVVKLSATANMKVYLNQKCHLIGPAHPVETTIEGDIINVVYPTQSIAAPALLLQADFLPGQVELDPTHSMREKIELHFTDEDKLKAAQRPDGTPLIPTGVSDSDIADVAAASKTMVQHINAEEDLPRGTVAGLARSASPQGLDQSFFSDLGHALGDIWHAAKKGFLKVVSVVSEVVSEGVKFIVKIGEQIFEWISKAVSDVFHFLEHIWEKIKLFFKDLYEFLAFLFNWDDIIRTKRVLKAHTSNMILGLADSLEDIRKKTYSFFEEVKAGIQEKKQAIAFDQLNGKDLNQLRNEHTKSDKTDPRANMLNSKQSQLKTGQTPEQVLAAIPPETAGPASEVIAALANCAEKLKDDFVGIFSDLFEKLQDVINGRMQVGAFLEYFVLSLAELGLDIAQEIIDLVFRLLEIAVRGVDAALKATIEIPFFSALYRKISGGDDLSIGDLIHLLLAVPVTVLYKLGKGHAPFADQAEEQEYIQSGTQIFQLQS